MPTNVVANTTTYSTDATLNVDTNPVSVSVAPINQSIQATVNITGNDPVAVNVSIPGQTTTVGVTPVSQPVTVKTTVGAASVDAVYVDDFLLQYGNNARLAIEAAIAAADLSRSRRVVLSAATYTLATPITVTTPNITIETETKNGATVAQSIWGLPAFLVAADNVTIRNLKIINTTNAKTRITSWVSGYNFGSLYSQRNVQRDYCAGVASVNCNATSVIDCEFRDFFSGVTLFGFYNSGVSPQRGLNHRMYDCTIYNCDMGILAYLTDGATIRGNRGYDIEWTQGSAPPHFGYMSVERNDDGDYTAGDDHYRLTYCDNICVNNPFSSGHKLKAVRESVVYNNTSTGCVRGFDIDYCFDSIFSDLQVKNTVEYVWPTNITHPQYLGTTTLSNQLSYNGGVPYDSQTSGINIVDCSNCTFIGCNIDKGSIDSCDAILLRKGDNGGTNNIKLFGTQILADNSIGLSGSKLNNSAVVGNQNTLARYKITAIDAGNNAAILDWSPVNTALADGTAVTIRTPLSGAVPPTPLAGGITYYIKQSAGNQSAAEFYTDAAMTQRVTLGGTLSGDVYIRDGVAKYVSPQNDCIYVNWNPVTGSIPNGSPVSIRRGTTQTGAALPTGLSENVIYWSKQSDFSPGWIELHATSALNNKANITAVGAGQLWIDTVVDLSLTNVGTSTFEFGTTVTNVFSNGTPVTVGNKNPGAVLPGGLANNSIYYLKATGTTFQLYTDAALTNLVTISSTGSGLMDIHTLKAASGYAINVSSAVQCEASDTVFRQLGTSAEAQSARPFRFTAGANAFVLDRYKVIGTNRHGQIDFGATNCSVNFNISETDSSANYSSSWVDNSNGASNTRFNFPTGQNPIGFSSNVAIPTIGIGSSVFQTNSSGSIRYLVGLQGLFWPGRVIRILSADNLTRIAVASISRAASGNVSTINDTIDLGVPVASLFADGTPVLVTSSGGPSAVPAGLTSGIPYFIKASFNGATTAEFYTDSSLTSKVDITGTGSSTLTIRTTAAQGCQSLSTRAQTNINTTTNEIDLGQSVAMLFGNGAAVTVSSSGTLAGGLAANTTYYVGTGPSGANFAQLFTNSNLTGLVDITSQGSGDLTIKTPGIGFRLAPGRISWLSSRNPFSWIEFTYSSTEGLWVQTGSEGLAQSNPDWNATFGAGQINNRPTVPAVVNPRDIVPSSPNIRDDEFQGTTLASTWVATNAANFTATVGGSWLRLYGAFGSGGCGTYTVPATISGSFTVTAKIHAVMSSTNYQSAGLCILDSTGKLITFGPSSDNGGPGMLVNYWNSRTTYTSTPFNLPGQDLFNSAFIRVICDGTNFTFQRSSDGVSFSNFFTATVGAHLGASPYTLGLYIQNDAGNGIFPTLFVDWFRVETTASPADPVMAGLGYRTIPNLTGVNDNTPLVKHGSTILFTRSNVAIDSIQTSGSPLTVNSSKVMLDSDMIVPGITISPTALAANQNDYNPTGLSTAATLLLSSSDHYLITGIVAPSQNSRSLTLINNGSHTITLRNQNFSTASAAANRFDLGSPELCITPGASVVLVYSTSASRWRVLRAPQPSLNNDTTCIRAFHDFAAAASTTAFLNSNSGTGSNIGSSGGNYLPRFGIVNFQTGTTTTGRAGISSGAVANQYAVSGNYLRFSSAIRTGASLSDATDTYLIYVGFGDSMTAEPIDGLYLKYDYTLNSGRWTAISRSNSADLQSTDTGVTVTASTWYRSDIIMLPDRSGEFWINGSLVATVSSANMIANSVNRSFGHLVNLRKTAGTSGRDIEIDWCDAVTTYAQLRTI